jgi:hypothetical protein
VRTKRIATIVTTVVVLALLLATNSTVASPPVEGGSSGITLAGTVASKISYQGRLTNADGDPLDGNYNLVFQLWDDPEAGGQVGGDIVRNNVLVSNGLFTVGLEVPQDAFNGQALWLRVQVSGQWLSPRQELLPVPYALSLKPGATISSPGPTALHGYNESGGYGVEGWSMGNTGVVGINGVYDPPDPPSGPRGVYGRSWDGVGVYGEGGHTGVYGNGTNDGVKGESTDGNAVHGISTNSNGVLGESAGGSGVRGVSTSNYGVVGRTDASDKSGVYGWSATGKGVEGQSSSTNQWVPAIYGKNEGAGDGVYGWSQNRHGTYGVTYSSDPNHAGIYGVNNGAGPAIKADGDLVVTGQYRGDIGPNDGAPFPRPAYDSGWQSIAQGETRPFPHGIGGNPDNYVVDLQFQDQAGGRHQLGYGGETYLSYIGMGYFNLDDEGAFWHDLNDQQILVTRMDNDTHIAKVRVRIWVYK